MFFHDYKYTQWVSFLCATVIQLYGGYEFYHSSLSSLKNRIADMNLLVSIGTLSAYTYSLLVLFFPEIFPQDARHLYFEASASVITFVLLGRYIEARVKVKATDFMKRLLNLKPKKASIVVDGSIYEVDAENIVKGDVVIVKPGETIPVDGVVIKGETEVDKSLISGESKPEFVKEGDYVVSGSINQVGVVYIKALKNAKESLMNQVINLLIQAQSKKPNIGRLADKVTYYFVPTILILSILTFDIWYFIFHSAMYGFVNMVAVLVVACPCALGLATPIAIVSIVGRGAKEGIFIKNPEIVEKINNIDVAIFDKTGTLTEGKMSVVDSLIKDESSLYLVKGLEKGINHPVSKAIQEYINSNTENLMFSYVKIIAGEGVVGQIDEKLIFAGNDKMIQKFKIQLDEESKIFYQQHIEKGDTVVFCGLGDRLIAVFALSDTVKKEAYDVIRKLKSKGIKTVMLTGDNQIVAKNISENLQIDEYKYGLTPVDKYKEVLKYKNQGKKVMFVGDGVNDAPALSISDIGIAVSNATDIVKESGDVILINSDLTAVIKVLNLSNFGLKIIKQNLFWAYIYNIITIPIAAGLLYPLLGILLNPVYAGVAMSFSSVSVVLNSIRVKNIKI